MTAGLRGAVQSAVMPRQRRWLTELGASLGTPVVFVKAAWSDAVLYGGRGERAGSDLDALVRPAAFDAMVAALTARGFRPFVPASHAVTVREHGRALAFGATGPWCAIDLHRGLSEPPWFTLDVARAIDRAALYTTDAGETILSLRPEDQVLFAALHHAHSHYALDGRHTEDIARMLRRFDVDWRAVHQGAREARMTLVLDVFVDHLRARGVDAPVAPWASAPAHRARRALVARWLDAGETLRARPARHRVEELLWRWTLLSDRPTALPRFALRHVTLRARDLLAR